MRQPHRFSIVWRQLAACRRLGEPKRTRTDATPMLSTIGFLPGSPAPFINSPRPRRDALPRRGRRRVASNVMRAKLTTGFTACNAIGCSPLHGIVRKAPDGTP
jgi:hypothetical protein